MSISHSNPNHPDLFIGAVYKGTLRVKQPSGMVNIYPDAYGKYFGYNKWSSFFMLAFIADAALAPTNYSELPEYHFEVEQYCPSTSEVKPKKSLRILN